MIRKTWKILHFLYPKSLLYNVGWGRDVDYEIHIGCDI